jgi:hypothetical protein
MRTEQNSRETDSKLAADQRKALSRRVAQDVEDSSRAGSAYAQGNAAHLAGAGQDQKLVMRQQDETVSKLGEGLTTLKEMASAINTELQEQEVIVDDIDRATDKAQSQMDSAIKTMEKLTGAKNSCQLCTIVILVVIFVVGACARLAALRSLRRDPAARPPAHALPAHALSLYPPLLGSRQLLPWQ